MIARATLEALGPTDFAEAVLATRMITAHFAARTAPLSLASATLKPPPARQRRRGVALVRRGAMPNGQACARAEKPAPLAQKRAVAAPDTQSPEQEAHARFTPEETECALDNDPNRLGSGELEPRIPLHRWQDMTMEERKIAETAPNKPTPAQLAVLGGHIAAADRRLLDAPMIQPFQSPPADAVP
jgi:hypothetical protein